MALTVVYAGAGFQTKMKKKWFSSRATESFFLHFCPKTCPRILQFCVWGLSTELILCVCEGFLSILCVWWLSESPHTQKKLSILWILNHFFIHFCLKKQSRHISILCVWRLLESPHTQKNLWILNHFLHFTKFWSSNWSEIPWPKPGNVLFVQKVVSIP